MPNDFNPIKERFELRGDTLGILLYKGILYASITVNADYSVTAMQIYASEDARTESIVEKTLIHVRRYVMRRHAVKPEITPAELLREFLDKSMAASNPASREPRGVKENPRRR